MLKKTVFLLCFTCFLYSSSAERNGVFTRVHRFRYPELFRDHVFDTLSEMGKEMFYAANIHPSCKVKKGYCIPRAECVGKDMLYITRICYKRDLVCCYDNTIRFPEVGNSSYTTPSTSTTPRLSTTTLTSTEDATVTTVEETTVTNAVETTVTTAEETTVTTEEETGTNTEETTTTKT